MGFDDGQIVLDNESGAYYAGQTVFGKVMFSQGKIKDIHGIYVDFKGFCKVHWTTTSSRRVGNRTTYHTVNHDSYEQYFRQKTFLFGNEHGDNHLQAGQHEFKFQFTLPPDCPTTFEGTYGHIRYRVKVVMLTTGMFSMNKDKWVPIRVHLPLDLNQYHGSREPIEYNLSSSYCCWCLSAGYSEITVRLPVSGYTPGQVIPMEVSCKNDSSVEIDELKFAIKKDVTFFAISQPGKRNEHDTVAEIKKGPIPAHTTRNWTVEMEVPAMDIYNVQGCNFINIEYTFKVSTEISGCHSGTDETHPITFGTIPLVGFQDNVQNPLQDQLPKPMVMAPDANCYPPPPVINQPLPNGYPNAPYPGNPVFPTTPNLGGRTSPYPPGNQPYPNVSPYPANPPYPGGNSPYPGQNPPYPSEKSPFLGARPPYPGGAAPYPPGSSPYPGNTPYSSDKSPYGSNSNIGPYPGARQSPIPPFPTGGTPLKTGAIGFGVPHGDGSKMPLLPMGAGVPYPTSPGSNPYATASAPEPSTPGSGEQKLPLDDNSEPPPYNPEYMKRPDEKQNENVQKKEESEKKEKENEKGNNDEKNN